MKQRTEFSKTFELSDGTHETEFFMQPVHYRSEATSTLLPIDASLEETLTSRGTFFSSKANAFHALLPTQLEDSFLSSDWVSVETSVARVAFRPASRPLLPEAAVASDSEALQAPFAPGRVAYPEAYEGASLEYVSGSGGVKETIVLDRYTGRNVYSFDLVSEGLTPSINEAGGVDFVSAESTVPVFEILPPIMEDSSQDENGEPAVTRDVRYELQPSLSGWRLDVVADKDWLASSERVYPVRIDPTILYSWISRAYASDTVFVSSQYPSYNLHGWYEDGAFPLKVGQQDSYYLRSFVKSTLLDDALADLRDLDRDVEIIYARLALWDYAASPNPKIVKFNKITSSWNADTITWNQQPSTAYWGSFSQYDDATSDLYVTDIVKEWYDNPGTNHGIMLWGDAGAGYCRYVGWDVDGSGVPGEQHPFFRLAWTTVPKVEIVSPSADVTVDGDPTVVWDYDDDRHRIEIDGALIKKPQSGIQIQVAERPGATALIDLTDESHTLPSYTITQDPAGGWQQNERYFIRMRAAGDSQDYGVVWSDWTEWQSFIYRSIVSSMGQGGIEGHRAADSIGAGASVELQTGALVVTREDLSGPARGGSLSLGTTYRSDEAQASDPWEAWRTPAPTLVKDDNQAPDPGFESALGTPNWVSAGDTTGVSVSLVTGGRTGAKCLRFYRSTASASTAYVKSHPDGTSAYPVYPGQHLEASAWVRSTGLNTEADATWPDQYGGLLKLHFWGADGQYLGTEDVVRSGNFADVDTAGAWVQLATRAVAPAGAYYARMNIEYANAWGTLYVDDAYFGDGEVEFTDGDGTVRTFSQVTGGAYTRDPLSSSAGLEYVNLAADAEVTASQPSFNDAPDPGFDKSLSTGGWYVSNSGITSQQTTAKRSGTGALRFTSSVYASGYVSPCSGPTSTMMPCVGGDKLYASMWIDTLAMYRDTTQAESGILLKMHYYNSSGTLISSSVSPNSVYYDTNGWRQVSLAGTAPTGAAFVKFNLEYRDCRGTLYVDDVELGKGTVETDRSTDGDCSSSTLGYDMVAADASGGSYLQYDLGRQQVLSSVRMGLWDFQVDDPGYDPGPTYTYRVEVAQDAADLGTPEAVQVVPDPHDSSTVTDSFSDGVFTSGGTWTKAYIGSSDPGSTYPLESNGALTIRGEGTDFWGTADQGAFVYETARSFAGDFTMDVRVDSVQNTNSWAKAGLMLRTGSSVADALLPGASTASMVQSPGNGAHFQYRDGAGTSAVSPSVANGETAPEWLRLVRTGNTITGYYSNDGQTWTKSASRTFTNMGSTVLMGMALTSHADGVWCNGVFDDIGITRASAASTGWTERTFDPVKARYVRVYALGSTVGHPFRMSEFQVPQWTLGHMPVVFDEAGRLTATADESGNITTWGSDSSGRVTSISEEGGRSITVNRDPQTGTPTSLDWHGIASDGTADTETGRIQYASEGATSTVRSDDGSGARDVVSYHYDASGRIDSITDADGIAMQIGYDPVTHKVSEVTYADGSTRSYDYGVTGGVKVTLSDSSQQQSLETLTAFSSDTGLVTRTVADPDEFALETQIAYDCYGHVRSVTDPEDNVTTTYTDAHGNTVWTDEAGQRTTRARYEDDLVTEARDAKDNVSTYQYDDARRLLSAAQAISEAPADEEGGEAANYSTYDDYGNQMTGNLPGSTSVNLLLNGTFERDPLTAGNGWDPAQDDNASWVSPGSVLYLGDHHLKVESYLEPSYVTSTRFVIDPENTYALSAWARGTGMIKVYEYDEEGDQVGVRYPVVFSSPVSTPFRRVSGMYWPHTDRDVHEVKVVVFADTGARVDLDNIRMEMATRLGGDNYCDNASFEQVAADLPITWERRSATYTTAEHSASYDMAVSGTRSARIKTFDDNSGYFYSDWIPVTAGEEYSASGYMKAVGVESASAIDVKWYDSNKVYMSVSAPVGSTSGDSDWTRYVANAVVPTGACFARIVLSCSAGDGTTYFDAVSLESARSLEVFDYDDTATYQVAADSVTGHRSTAEYDARGREVSSAYEADPGGDSTVTAASEFDGQGRLATATVMPGALAQGDISASYAYTAAGRLWKVTDPLGRVYEMDYDQFGRLASVKDPLGYYSRTLYDGLGRVSQVMRPSVSATSSVPMTTNRYDTAGRANQTEYHDASGTVVATSTATYDANSNVTGQSLSYAGQRLSATSVYDELNRPVSGTSSGPAGPLSFSTTYDDADLPLVSTWTAFGNEESVENVWVKTNELKTTKLASSLETWYFAFDVSGAMTRAGGGIGSHMRTYDAAGRLNSVQLGRISTSGDITPWALLALTHDEWERIGSVTTDFMSGEDAADSYHYDAAGRLEDWTRTGFGAGTTSYGYDLAGNLVSKTVNNVTTAYEVNAANQLTSSVSGALATDYDYDDLGRLVCADDGSVETSYTWNDLGQLAQISDGQTTSTYAYGIDGMRQSKTVADGQTATTTLQVWSGTKLVSEYDTGEKIRYDYLYGPGGMPLELVVTDGVEQPISYAYQLDAGGSVIGMTDAAGTEVARYAYDPYGNPVAQTGTDPIAARNPLRYRGYYLDSETGLYYLPARYYDPQTARFLSGDPVGASIDNPVSVNAYAYCQGDPVGRFDPTGASCLSPDNVGELREQGNTYILEQIADVADDAGYHLDEYPSGDFEGASKSDWEGDPQHTERTFVASRLRNLQEMNTRFYTTLGAGVELSVRASTALCGGEACHSDWPSARVQYSGTLDCDASIGGRMVRVTADTPAGELVVVAATVVDAGGQTIPISQSDVHQYMGFKVYVDGVQY